MLIEANGQYLTANGQYLTTSGFEHETLALLTRMDVLPNTSVQNLINTTILNLKIEGIWQLADCLYVKCTHRSQAAQLNWIKNAHNITSSNLPPFQPGYGFEGSNSPYLDTNYNPYLQAVNFQQQSACFMVGMLTGDTNGKVILGARDTSTGSTTRLYYYGSINEYGYINSSTNANNQLNVSAPVNRGIDINFYSYDRNGEYVQGYVNGTSIGTNQLVPSTVPVNYNIYELGENLNGTVGSQSTSHQAFSFYGGYLGSSKQNALYTHIKYFFDNFKNCFTYGEELVLNGGFDSSANWNLTSSFTINDGKLNYDDLATAYADQNINITLNKYYRVSFTINTSINAYVGFRNSLAQWIFDGGLIVLGNGNFDMILKADYNTSTVRINANTAGSSIWSMDNLSIKEVLDI